MTGWHLRNEFEHTLVEAGADDATGTVTLRIVGHAFESSAAMVEAHDLAMEFKDHFSGHAADYARFRPRYPASLFEHVAALARRHDLAWDCATGSGQAAGGLAGHFARVIATDASAQQIEQADRHDGVDYAVAPAEAAPLEPASVDLIAVAQALHWFDLPAFYAEVRRVARPGGALAVWCYDRLLIDDLDDIVERLYTDILGPYWFAERALVEAGYRTLPFPFEELTAPSLAIVHHWTLSQLRSYLGTWSSSKRFEAEVGHSPLRLVDEELARRWGDPEEEREIRWPVLMRLGRV